jgi:hypothetical protein
VTLFRCRHRHTYIERRALTGTDIAVLHYVCHDCGHAAPIMHRTAEEHARMVALGAPMPFVVRKA